MSLWVCQECTTRYSVDAPQCPHCGATEYLTLAEQEAKDGEDDMAKSTVHGGPSNETEEVDVNIGAPVVGAPRVGEDESTTDDDAPTDEPTQVDTKKTPAKKAAPAKASAK